MRKKLFALFLCLVLAGSLSAQIHPKWINAGQLVHILKFKYQMLLKELSAAPTHTSGYGSLYVLSSDGRLYFKDDAGAVSAVGDSLSSGGYDSFAAAITAIGSTEATLVVASQEAVTADVTVPATLALRFERGGSLNISSTKTVTLNHPPDAGLWRIFYGAGTIAFGVTPASPSLEVYPEWWGAVPYDVANVVDSYAAIQAATDTGFPVIFSSFYVSEDTIDFDNTYSQVTWLGRTPGGRRDLTTGPLSGIGFTTATKPGIEIKFTSGGTERVLIENMEIRGTSGTNSAHNGIVVTGGENTSIDWLLIRDCSINRWGQHDVWLKGGTGIVSLRDNMYGNCGDYAIMIEDGYYNTSPPDVTIEGGAVQGECIGAIAFDSTSVGTCTNNRVKNFNIELTSYPTKPLIYIKNSYGIVLDSVIIATSVATVTPDDAVISVTGASRDISFNNVMILASGGLNCYHFDADVVGVHITGGFNSNKASMGAGLGYYIYNEATNLRLICLHPTFGTFTTGRAIVYDDSVTLRGLVITGTNSGFVNASYGFGFGTQSPSTHADVTLGNGALCMAETTTPTADTTYGKIYTKTDNILYFQDGAGTEKNVLSYYLDASESWNPSSIGDGAKLANDVTVSGAALGDFAIASFSLDVEDLSLTADVTAADTVTCVLANTTGGAVDLGDGTIYVKVIKR